MKKIIFLLIGLIILLPSILFSFGPLSMDGKRYILDDEFTTSRLAGTINGTASEQALGIKTNVNNRTVVDTSNLLLNIYNSGLGAQLIVNGNFESAGTGGADVFASWTETAGTGSISKTTVAEEIHGGTSAAKLVVGTDSTFPQLTQTFTVTGGGSYSLRFWTRGDGTNSGYYLIYDNTNSKSISSDTNGISGTNYQLKTINFVLPVNCSSLMIYLRGPRVNGGITFYDDISLQKIIPNGVLYFEGGKASPSYGDPGIWYPSVVRKTGLGFLTNFNTNSIGTAVKLGFDLDTSGDILAGSPHFGIVSDNSLRIFDTSTGITILTVPSSINFSSYISLRGSLGAFYFLKGSNFYNWNLIWKSDVGNNTILYPTIQNYNSKYFFDSVRIPLTLWTPNFISYDDFNHSSDNQTYYENLSLNINSINGSAGITSCSGVPFGNFLNKKIIVFDSYNNVCTGYIKTALTGNTGCTITSVVSGKDQNWTSNTGILTSGSPFYIKILSEDTLGSTKEISIDNKNVPVSLWNGNNWYINLFELIVNSADRNFTSDTSFWTKNSGVTISGNVCNFSNVAYQNGLTKNGILNLGTKYQITYTISNYSSGDIWVYAGLSSIGEIRNANGTYTDTLVCSGDTMFRINAHTAGTTLSINNISIKAVGASSVPTVIGSELFPSGDMESDTGWVTYNTTSSQGISTEQFFNGSNSRKVTLDGSGTYSGTRYLNFPQTIGDWYSISGWFRGLDLASGSFYLNGIVGDIFHIPYSNGSWVNLFGTIRAAASSSAIVGYVYPTSASNAGKSFYIDNFLVKKLDFKSLISNIYSYSSDVEVEISPNIVQGTQAGLIVNLDSSDNPKNFVLIYNNGVAIKLDKCVNGVYTNLLSNSYAYVPGAVLKVCKNGFTYSVFYNNVKQGSDITISDDSIINNTSHGIFNTYQGNVLNNFHVMPIGNGYTFYNSAPTTNIPVLVGSELLVNGTFNTDINGWTLSTPTGGTITWDNGNIKFTEPAVSSYLYAYQTIPTTIGTWYSFNTDILWESDMHTYLRLGTTSLNSSVGSNFDRPHTTMNSYTITGKAISTTTYATLYYGGAANYYGLYDNTSIKALSLPSLFFNIKTSINSDVVLKVNPTILQGTNAGLVLSLDSTTNPQNFILAYYDGYYLKLDKCVNGVYTNLMNYSQGYASNTPISVVKKGSNYSLYLKDILIATTTVSDTSIINNKLHGIFNTYQGNTFTNFSLSSGSEYDIINSF